MSFDRASRTDWASRLVWFVVAIVLGAAALQLLAELVRPLVPWIGVALIVFAVLYGRGSSRGW